MSAAVPNSWVQQRTERAARAAYLAQLGELPRKELLRCCRMARVPAGAAERHAPELVLWHYVGKHRWAEYEEYRAYTDNTTRHRLRPT